MSPNMKLFIRLTGCFTFLILLLFSIIFYQERILTLDAAMHDFFIVLKKYTSVQWLRCGAIITQSLPLIFRLLHFPLKTILISHSTAFIGFYFIIFSIITFWLKQELVALGFLFSLLLFTNDSFYWMTSEIPQQEKFSMDSERSLKQILFRQLRQIIVVSMFYACPESFAFVERNKILYKSRRSINSGYR